MKTSPTAVNPFPRILRTGQAVGRSCPGRLVLLSALVSAILLIP